MKYTVVYDYSELYTSDMRLFHRSQTQIMYPKDRMNTSYLFLTSISISHKETSTEINSKYQSLKTLVVNLTIDYLIT